MIWVGLDHKRYITACARDDAGAVLAEQRRLPTATEALVAWLQELGGPVTVAMDPDDELAAGEPAVLRNGTGETAGEFGAA